MSGLLPTRRSLIGVGLALSLAVAGAAGPVAAAAPDRGDHGAQARCMYKSTELPGWTGAMRLNRLTVLPPTLFSASPEGGSVGWRLIVQRRYDYGAWTTIFTSRVQRADATQTESAALSPLSALINSPQFLPDGHGSYRTGMYRAALKFFWFNADGSVMSQERHTLSNYDAMRDGRYVWTDSGLCYHGWIFDH